MNHSLPLAFGFSVLSVLACSGEDLPPSGEGGSGGGPAVVGESGGQSNSASGGQGPDGSGGAGMTDAGSGGGTASGGTFDSGDVHVAVDACNESSNSSFNLSGDDGQFGVTEVDMNGGAKSYILAANWWSSYNGQSISGTGNSFTINGGAGNANMNMGAPAGYPTLYFGSYNGSSSKGSSLPTKVSELNSVPTVFRTNGTQFGMDYYNAAYDVWFTATDAEVPGYSPGQGGAYLMVWTFDPENKRPRGPGDEPQFSAMTVPGVTGKWDVWVDPSNPPCISYVATEPVDDLGFDLKHFIDDSVQNSYGVTSEMYLAIVFAGFEVWAGGDGLRVDEFCVDVQ